MKIFKTVLRKKTLPKALESIKERSRCDFQVIAFGYSERDATRVVKVQKSLSFNSSVWDTEVIPCQSDRLRQCRQYLL